MTNQIPRKIPSRSLTWPNIKESGTDIEPVNAAITPTHSAWKWGYANDATTIQVGLDASFVMMVFHEWEWREGDVEPLIEYNIDPAGDNWDVSIYSEFEKFKLTWPAEIPPEYFPFLWIVEIPYTWLETDNLDPWMLEVQGISSTHTVDPAATKIFMYPPPDYAPSFEFIVAENERHILWKGDKPYLGRAKINVGATAKLHFKTLYPKPPWTDPFAPGIGWDAAIQETDSGFAPIGGIPFGDINWRPKQ